MSLMISLWDIGLFSASSGLFILLVSEVLSPHYGRINLCLSHRRLRIVAAALVLTFVVIGIIVIQFGR